MIFQAGRRKALQKNFIRERQRSMRNNMLFFRGSLAAVVFAKEILVSSANMDFWILAHGLVK